MTARQPNTIVIGVGNTYRSDDGVGIAVARRLRERTSIGATIVEVRGDGAALLEAWKGAAAIILVDAVHSGAPPGTIHRLDARSEKIPSRFFHGSTHAFSVAEAIELARALDQLPPCLIVYGIEGESFAAAIGLSACVEQAAATVTALVFDEVQAFMKSRASGAHLGV